MDPQGLSHHLALWAAGIRDELEFWDAWFAGKGGRWPEDYARRLDPQREIAPELMQGLDGLRVLDVGAGPMTILGSQYEGRRLDLTACDPLATFYAEIAAKHGVERPAPTQIGFAEDLSAFFPADRFDLVYCRNALDHSFDPIRGIEEMLTVAKPGGRVVLEHNVNEAEAGQYQGLHQWNFDSDGGDLIVWNKTERVNASVRLCPYADIEIDASRERWIAVRMRKRRSPGTSPDRDRLRLCEVLTAMTAVFGQGA